ncbi:MAG: CDGSH iron-sulfur domain-containing protein [Candidatus Gracilibacteria bacterium]|nr:CDGSH iron-sulfur domain-containing protein [Candidatus Gracilibacteria bacterium]MDD3120078.1 CDGSH iron-sulfur domain-containing protein [Candidatus Gracilibacteria bacterium]MDD4530284.1 CDGSH iron-sulfur domain-containing protein [Candidatus Gracilibacteria bacterium]
MEDNKRKIKITKNGPYLVTGNIPLAKEIIIGDFQENPIKWEKGDSYPKEETYALCRCGNSKNKPYCDGSHVKTEFNGTETASKEKYLEQAGKIEGDGIYLTDVPDFCSAARFCHRAGGTWNLTKNSSDPKSKEIAIEEACNCPSGRLVMWDEKTGKPIEKEFEPQTSIIEDSTLGVSGPIWVKGGIPIEGENGEKYETRNRVTLCRCGHSQNKPYCDGSHIDVEFNDGDKNIN